MSDKQQEISRNIWALFFAGGIAFIIAALYFYVTGEIKLKMEHQIDHRRVTADDNPVEYWILMSIVSTCGVGLIYFAIKLRSKTKKLL